MWVVVLFVLLRVRYQPYLFGGPGGLLVAVPVAIIATGLLVYDTTTLFRWVRHLPCPDSLTRRRLGCA